MYIQTYLWAESNNEVNIFNMQISLQENSEIRSNNEVQSHNKFITVGVNWLHENLLLADNVLHKYILIDRENSSIHHKMNQTYSLIGLNGGLHLMWNKTFNYVRRHSSGCFLSRQTSRIF